MVDESIDSLTTLLPVYEELFEILAKRGATCVQLDEPSFTGDRTPAELSAFEPTYQRLSTSALRPRMLVTGPYGDFGAALVILAATRVEAIGLDVLVHGEHERNDMVQYFGELLDGFASTHFGWVQAYGSRTVRPPILYGDVSRPSRCPSSGSATPSR